MSAPGDDLRKHLIIPASRPIFTSPVEDLKKHLIIPSSRPLASSPSFSNTGPAPTASSAFLNFNPRVETEDDRSKAHRGSDEAESNMEIDTPTQPPVFASAHDEQKTTARAAPPTGIFSMEEFMKQNLEKHQAQREAMRATPPAKKAKTSENASPAPVAVGARSSKYTILLHEKYQGLNIPQPLFTYEGGSGSGWNVSVSFPGLENAEELQGLTDSKQYNSKQEAKEALSQKAFTILEELEKEGRVTKTAKARKKIDNGIQIVERQQPEENYVGKLLEFQRSISAPQPLYIDYQSGTRFACLLTLEDHPEPFGSLNSLFSSKKAARQDAARHAILHFQSLGVWPDESSAVGGIKKKKKAQNAPSPTASATASTEDVNSPSGNTNSTSFAQQVATIAASLTLPTPEWRFTPHPSDPTFHTVACFFRGAGPHEGPIGEVRNVFGKKKAKEECARLALEYLLDVREKRRAYGARMMAGVVGGEGVLSGAEGRNVEGEEELLWEDAVEMMG
ncbi:hypothetical protein yc1106_06502 [Curvularia clavata]|uniref:DRBM domain-containing protein n=1 Tax=Curvularia clavata TaxID=95742 RepID=A0A9Q8ZEF5_CURCL|nr:hypothetical protein yc1106_06502 [Curvularia clavata]